jgi:mRNA-degrading endonuclease RelE of RelBE toxin-antitoxin system
MPYSICMVFIEAPIFSKHIYDYLDDKSYSALQQALALRPEAGKKIPGSGGLRKIRWAGAGRGKRGGLRIIYYWLREDGQIWLLTVYAKNEAENIPNSVLKLIRKEMEK